MPGWGSRHRHPLCRRGWIQGQDNVLFLVLSMRWVREGGLRQTWLRRNQFRCSLEWCRKIDLHRFFQRRCHFQVFEMLPSQSGIKVHFHRYTLSVRVKWMTGGELKDEKLSICGALIGKAQHCVERRHRYFLRRLSSTRDYRAIAIDLRLRLGYSSVVTTCNGRAWTKTLSGQTSRAMPLAEETRTTPPRAQ